LERLNWNVVERTVFVEEMKFLSSSVISWQWAVGSLQFGCPFILLPTANCQLPIFVKLAESKNPAQDLNNNKNF